MSDENTGPTTGGEGQAATAPQGTTGAAPTSAEGQAAQDGNKGTSAATAPTTPEEDTFFDPKSVPPELMPAYKQMQKAFSKKTQTIAQQRQKLEAYDAFMTDPVTNLKSLAGQYGLQITQAQAQAAVQQAAQEGNWEPQSWDEVFSKVEEKLMAKLQGQLKPVFDNVQQQTAANIEKQLDAIDGNWKLYEDDMMATLKAHPSLVGDVGKLYRLSVPEDVLTSRAVQAALKKLEDKTKGAQIHGSNGNVKTASVPKKAASFQEAVEQAREAGKKDGWYK